MDAWTQAATAAAKLPPSEFFERWKAADPATRDDLLRARFRFDVAGFLKHCFPGVYELPWNAFHLAELGAGTPPWPERKATGTTVRRVVAAPRGVAKTTLLKGQFVHDVVYGLERYVVVLSAEERLALSINRDIRAMFLDGDSELARLYGPFEVEGQVEEFAVRVRGRPAVAFLARSFGTQVRGANWKSQRPTKIVIDDGERPDRVRSPEQRRIWTTFLRDDVLKAGPRGGGCLVEWRGTVLHPDAVIAHLLRDPGWQGRKWQAIVAWPERADLWEECRRIWADLTRPDRLTAARAFYEANRAEMDRGAEVLDDEAEPLYACYELIWAEGLASFLREKQNDPTDPSTRLFQVERFARCRLTGNTLQAADGRRMALSELRIVFRLDPALGKRAGLPGDTGAGAGDYAAIAVLGRDRWGYGYLLDLWMRRARPEEQIGAIWTLHERWKFARGSIESNGFQALMGRDFRRMQEERKKAGKSWMLVVDEDVSTTPKDIRIASLEPVAANGWLQFSESLSPEVLGQFSDFPTGQYDDGPDAVEGAWRNSAAAPMHLGQDRIV